MFDEFTQRLAKHIPPERLLFKAGQLVSFESDGLTAFAVRPRGVVIPDTHEEVIEIVRACHEFEVPFVARGSGTSLSGGSLPIKDGVVIALNRLNKILSIDSDSRIAVVEPGAINLEVSKQAEPFGLYYAPDPSSQQICTIGGNIAFNSGGAHCLKYGMTSNHVLGMKIVTPDGEVVELGSSSLESVGPDCHGLFVGSEGLMGVVLEITLRLLPKPASFFTLMAGYDKIEQAGDAVTAIVASGLLPGAIEIMDELSMEAARVAVNAEFPKNVKANLIVELDGSAEQVAAERIELEQIIAQSNPKEIIIAKDDETRATIWKGRKSAFSAVGRISKDFIVQDSVVPRTKLGFALKKIDEISAESGIRVANVFHAGDGNLHPLILFDGNVKGELERAEEVAAKIVKLCIELGGSITGEHGVGMEKRQFLSEMFAEQDITTMKQIRKSLDPNEIANRGKMFPSSEAPALSLYGLHPLEEAGIISRE